MKTSTKKRIAGVGALGVGALAAKRLRLVPFTKKTVEYYKGIRNTKRMSQNKQVQALYPKGVSLNPDRALKMAVRDAWRNTRRGKKVATSTPEVSSVTLGGRDAKYPRRVSGLLSRY